MAIQTRRLDKKARRAILILLTVVVAGPLFLVGRHVVETMEERSNSSLHRVDDQLVELPDGTTMLVKHGTRGRQIFEWLRRDKEGEESFHFDNSNFAGMSATLTHDGWEHLAQLARMLKAHHEVSAEVLYSAHQGKLATLQLEHVRADRVHDQVVRFGVSDDQVDVARESFDPGHNSAADEGLEVVLINKQ